jgi:hypothetical protein
MPFNKTQYSVIIGSLLGDGGIEKSGMQFRFSEEHTSAQMLYLEWKAIILEAEMKSINRNFGLTYRARTPSTQEWIDLRKEWYPNGIKIIPKSILYNLDELALTVWFLDDGDKPNAGVMKNGEPKQLNAYRISTAGFTYQDNLLLIQALHKNFDIQPTLCHEKNHSKKYYRLYFGSKNRVSDKFIEIVKRNIELYQIPKIMLYKCGERVETRQGKAPISQKNLTRNLLTGKFESLRYSPNYSQ